MKDKSRIAKPNEAKLLLAPGTAGDLKQTQYALFKLVLIRGKFEKQSQLWLD